MSELDERAKELEVVGALVHVVHEYDGELACRSMTIDGGPMPHDITSSVLELPPTPRLKELTVLRLPELEELRLEAPKLEFLHIRSCPALVEVGPLGRLKDLQMQAPLSALRGSLSTVRNIHGAVLDEASVPSLIQLENIGHLVLRVTASQTTLDWLPALPKLRALTVSSQHLTSLDGVQRLTGLRNLRVHSPALEDVEALRDLPGLKEVDFEGCSALRDIGAVGAVKRLRLVNLKGTRVRPAGVPASLLPPRSPSPIYPPALARKAKALQAAAKQKGT